MIPRFLTSLALGLACAFGSTNPGLAQDSEVRLQGGTKQEIVQSIIVGQSAGSSASPVQPIIVGQSAGASASPVQPMIVGQSAGASASPVQPIIVGQSAGASASPVQRMIVGHSAGASASPVQATFQLADRLNSTLYWINTSPIAGLTLAPADQTIKSHLGLPNDRGLVVSSVEGSSSAAHAGLCANDVLVTLGDKPLASADGFEKLLKSVGEKPAKLSLLREGKLLTIDVQPRFQVSLNPVSQPAAQSDFWIGVQTSSVDPTLRSQLRLGDHQGLTVTQVFAHSPAASADLKSNDIIIAVDREQLVDRATLTEAVQAHGEKPMSLEIIRGGKKMDSPIVVKPERRKRETLEVSVDTPRWDILRAGGGVVVHGQNTTLGEAVKYIGSSHPEPHSVPGNANTNEVVLKRLEALDTLVKEVQKAVEELNKASREKK